MGQRVTKSPCVESGANELAEAFEAIYRLWRDVREAEGARLESVCTLTGYRGFESLSLRITPLALWLGSVQSAVTQPRQARKGAAVSDQGCATGYLTGSKGVFKRCHVV
jgi:hypothetical protein